MGGLWLAAKTPWSVCTEAVDRELISAACADRRGGNEEMEGTRTNTLNRVEEFCCGSYHRIFELALLEGLGV